jgi:hypothetical protein
MTSSPFFPSFSCPTARMAWLQWKRFSIICLAFRSISSSVMTPSFTDKDTIKI